MKLKGLHNIYNALCAISVGIFYEIPLSIIKQGIESVHSVSGRFEMINVGNNINAVVDYAHTPDALEKTLKAISQFKPKRIITLFGCGGERDKLKRPLLWENCICFE